MIETTPKYQFFSDLGIFGAPEAAVIDLLQRRSGESNDLVLAAVGLAVWAHRNGHPCVHLQDVEGLVANDLSEANLVALREKLPTAAEFMDALSASPGIVRKIEQGKVGTYFEASSDLHPLVLVGGLLFTQRQFADELSIAEQLKFRANLKSGMSVTDELVDRLVEKPHNDPEADKVGDTGIANMVARSVSSNCLTVLTGGPGTGKTHVLTRCLALMLSAREKDLDDLSIALIAPTGKAAARAKEMLNNLVEDERNPEKDKKIGLSEKVLDSLSRIEPRTIQRALGSKRRMHTRFQHDYQSVLPHDIVIVDEMSMVPSYLMARLLEAIRPNATILLVGDQAQLESVESGSVLRDIVVASTAEGSPLNSRVFELLRVWRQTSETKIGDLARHIRAGRADEALALAITNPSGIKFVESKKRGEVSESIIDGTIQNLRKASDFAAKLSLEDHKDAYRLIEQNKVLCGPRNGPLGVSTWNTLLGRAVQGALSDDQFHPGTPLLITVNSPRSKLVNGAIGVVVNAQDSDGTINRRVFFESEDGERYLTPAELPQFEVCYSMTVHKSQGSEYDNLVVILPDENSPLLTRELVYTAVTRTKKSLTIAGTSNAFVQSINNESTRYSGLKTLLSLVN
jgi:exodeoxyribonuclease V alpha subunit